MLAHAHSDSASMNSKGIGSWFWNLHELLNFKARCFFARHVLLLFTRLVFANLALQFTKPPILQCCAEDGAITFDCRPAQTSQPFPAIEGFSALLGYSRNKMRCSPAPAFTPSVSHQESSPSTSREGSPRQALQANTHAILNFNSALPKCCKALNSPRYLAQTASSRRRLHSVRSKVWKMGIRILAWPSPGLEGIRKWMNDINAGAIFQESSLQEAVWSGQPVELHSNR